LYLLSTDVLPFLDTVLCIYARAIATGSWNLE
jgi:hypothetical protein